MRSRSFRSALLAAALAAALAAPASGGARAGEEAGPEAASSAPPIEWLPWSERVFERAKKEQRGVLLTIVSRWCRSCVIEDRDVFGDPEVRRLVAERWIPVRVDRDDRPDIDSRYQAALAIFSDGQTGLPAILFLFPTGEAMHGDVFTSLLSLGEKPGLRSLLVKTDDYWRERFPQARISATLVQDYFDGERKRRRDPPPPKDFLKAVVGAVASRADAVNGGFGDVPRFTNPFGAELALLAARRNGEPDLRDAAVRALRAAVRGASFDHVGGGFRRCARDEAWSIAFLDKPLSVNAVYLQALTEAVRATQDDELAAAAGRTIDFVLGTLRAPEGGFFSGQAAGGTPEDETGYHTWRVEEVREILGAKDLELARHLLGFKEQGEIRLGLPPKFLPVLLAPLEEAASAAGLAPDEARRARERILAALGAARSSRPAPPVGDARHLDSTALTASALLHAGAVLGRSDAIDAALEALDEILSSHRRPARGVPHVLGRGKPPVLMADTAYLGLAFLDAFDWTGRRRYLDAAAETARALRALFLDEQEGGFYDVTADAEAPGYLRLRRKTLVDGIQPCPQAAAARLLDALADRTADDSWRRGVEETFSWIASRLPALDHRSASTGLALDAHLQEPVRIVVEGDDAGAEPIVRAAWRLYEPGRVIERRRGTAGPAGASVCVGGRCREGLADPSSLEKALADLRAAGSAAVSSVAAP